MNFVIGAALLLGAQILAACSFVRTAHADDGPICRRPEILAFAMDNFQRADAHIKVVADSTTEVATSHADIVICALTVQVEFYDSADYRDRPAVLSQPRYFEVKRLRDGFEVDFGGR
jgi:hypothetical protein